MASQTKLPLSKEGKISKAGVLLQIMREEEEAGRELDMDRIVGLARERISKAAPDLQPAKEVTRVDYRTTYQRFTSSSNGRGPPEKTIPSPQRPIPKGSGTSSLPFNKGRVSKTHLLAQIIREEEAAGRTLDRKKILLIAQKRIEQLPESQRPEFPIQRRDYDNASRSVRGLPPYGKGKPTPQEPQVETPPTEEKITLEDLQAAKLYVSSCGGSQRAAAVLLALTNLMKG